VSTQNSKAPLRKSIPLFPFTAVAVDTDMSEAHGDNVVKGRPGLTRVATPPSKRNFYAIDAKSGLISCDEDDVFSKRGEGSFWIDATVYNTRDAEELQNNIIDKMDVSPFLQRHLRHLERLKSSHVLTLSSSDLIVVRILPDDSKEIRYAVALCVKGILLTVAICPENEEAVAAERVQSQKILRCMRERELPQASTTGALSVWLMCHLDRVANVLNNLRMRMFDLSEIMEINVASVDLPQISGVKDELLHVLSVAEDQVECVESIAEGESITSSIDFSGLRGTLGVLLSTAASTERMALRLEKRISDLRHMYDAHQQDRINHRLTVLTIFSAVFLPMTLMAGIWGMNWSNMPELERENGYYFGLAAIVSVGLIMLSTFYCLGWFN